MSLSTPYNRALHAFATVTALLAFLLIIAGALVTSNDAGMSIPYWPMPLGSMDKLAPMVGGARLAYAHRLIAELVAVCTFVLAAWTSRTDRRPWMRKLAWGALATIVLQGVLGGLAVRNSLPAGISSLHATLAQTFFCLVVAVWLFTGRKWVQEPRMSLPTKKPSLQVLTGLAVTAIYIELVLGAAFRHGALKLLPHVVGAAIVTFVVLWTVVRILTEYAKVDQLRRPAIALMSLLMVQLGLGFGSWVTRVEFAREGVPPGAAVIFTTVAHVAVGALLLATAVVLAIQAWRHVAIPTAETIPQHAPKVVAI